MEEKREKRREKRREKERKSEGERKWNVATADGFSTRNETTQSD